MWIVNLALRRPYTFIVLAVFILIAGVLSIVSTPKDIFPSINIPVISVIFNFAGSVSEGYGAASDYGLRTCADHDRGQHRAY